MKRSTLTGAAIQREERIAAHYDTGDIVSITLEGPERHGAVERRDVFDLVKQRLVALVQLDQLLVVRPSCVGLFQEVAGAAESLRDRALVCQSLGVYDRLHRANEQLLVFLLRGSRAAEDHHSHQSYDQQGNDDQRQHQPEAAA